MRVRWFTLSVLFCIAVLLATAALFVYIEWDMEGWPFWGGITLGIVISGLALHAVPDFWRLLREDLRR